MNYRSVVVFGTATTVEDADEKLAALYAFTEHIILVAGQRCVPPVIRRLPEL
jgi:nitroimidazol reductase NimA-like FMN-containing flavoprotein (pyridoxamine 5'-phosphate oxidase superfamily)